MMNAIKILCLSALCSVFATIQAAQGQFKYRPDQAAQHQLNYRPEAHRPKRRVEAQQPAPTIGDIMLENHKLLGDQLYAQYIITIPVVVDLARRIMRRAIAMQDAQEQQSRMTVAQCVTLVLKDE